MIVDIGYYLSAAIALTIVLVGVYFLVAPYAAAEGFGVTVVRGRWDAYPLVKAVRDIGAGIFTAILILNRSTQLLGLFLLAATIIPLTDAMTVLKHGGSNATAFGIHGVTASIILITSVLLLLG